MSSWTARLSSRYAFSEAAWTRGSGVTPRDSVSVRGLEPEAEAREVLRQLAGVREHVADHHDPVRRRGRSRSPPCRRCAAARATEHLFQIEESFGADVDGVAHGLVLDHALDEAPLVERAQVRQGSSSPATSDFGDFVVSGKRQLRRPVPSFSTRKARLQGSGTSA
jgi:hypothetical protein